MSQQLTNSGSCCLCSRHPPPLVPRLPCALHAPLYKTLAYKITVDPPSGFMATPVSTVTTKGRYFEIAGADGRQEQHFRGHFGSLGGTEGITVTEGRTQQANHPAFRQACSVKNLPTDDSDGEKKPPHNFLIYKLIPMYA